MIEAHQPPPSFGLGEFAEVGSSNPSVLASLGRFREDPVLFVNHLSRFPQPVELDLSAYRGRQPVELTGGVRFPLIGDLPYLLTLPGHGFYWFEIMAVDEG